MYFDLVMFLLPSWYHACSWRARCEPRPTAHFPFTEQVQWVPITLNLLVHVFMYYVSERFCPISLILNGGQLIPLAAVLCPISFEDQGLVEEVSHAASDYTICHGSHCM